MAIRGFIVTGVLPLHTPYSTVVDDARAFDGVVVILVGNGQRVKGLEYLSAKLVFRMVNEHHRERITAIRQLLLCLCGNNRASTEQNY